MESQSDVRLMEERQPRTVVLVPTFNESEAVSRTIDDIFAHLSIADILVIDDSSPDGTANVVKEHERFGDGLELISRAARTGLADAYREGMAWALAAGYQRVVQMDADGSHRGADLPSLMRACSTEDTLVVGSRWIPGGRIENWSFFRRLLSRGGNYYARRVLSCDVPDLTSGFRVWGSEALSRALTTEESRMTGYGFQIEMAWTHWRRTGGVQKVPICFVERTAGKSKMSLGITWEAARGLIELRLRGCRPS